MNGGANFSNDPRYAGIPFIVPSGVASTGMFSDLGNADGWNPVNRDERTYALSANITKVRGPHALLGRAYVQVGRYGDALPHLTIAVKEDQDGETHLQLARALEALGRPADAQKAMAEYQRLRQQAAPSGTVEKTLTPPK